MDVQPSQCFLPSHTSDAAWAGLYLLSLPSNSYFCEEPTICTVLCCSEVPSRVSNSSH